MIAAAVLPELDGVSTLTKNGTEGFSWWKRFCFTSDWLWQDFSGTLKLATGW